MDKERNCPPPATGRWQQTEWTFTAERDYANPYTEIDLHLDFTGPDGQTLRRPAFWNGGRDWRVRFAAPTPGAWTWRSVASVPQDRGLHGRRGEIRIEKYQGDHPLTRHGLLRMSPGGRNVVHADGTPFLVVADTPWALPFRGTPEAVAEYARDRREKGFNAALLMSIQPDRDACGPRNRHEVGGFEPGFADLPEGHLNELLPDYFQQLDSLLEILHAHGMVPVLQPVFQGFGWKGKRALGKQAVPSEYARYCRYLVARYGARPAIWLVSADGTGKEPSAEPAGREVEAWDAYAQPTGIHYSPFDDYQPDWTTDPDYGFHHNRSHQDAPWLDFQWCQTGHGGKHLPEKVRRMYANQPTKGAANGEPTYEAIRDRDNGAGWWQGHEAWSNFTAGGTMGVVYGAAGLWQWKLFPDEPGWAAWCDGPGLCWRSALELPGSRLVGHLGQALAGYDLTDLSLLPEIGPHAVGKPDSFLCVYLPEGGSVSLAGLGRELPCRWFNPRTGEWADAERATPHAPVCHAPSPEPWVLLAGEPRQKSSR